MTQSFPAEPRLLTIAELARSLDLPESTTRYYCNRFAAHLPSVGEGRRRRYKPEALEKLQTIAQTMRRDKNAYAVDLVLQNKEPGPLLPAAMQGQANFAGQILAMMENQTKALQDIAQAMAVFAERLAVPSPPQPAGASPEKPETGAGGGETSGLHDEIASLREQIRASESVHQNDLEQLRKWLTRLGEAVANK